MTSPLFTLLAEATKSQLFDALYRWVEFVADNPEHAVHYDVERLRAWADTIEHAIEEAKEV